MDDKHLIERLLALQIHIDQLDERCTAQEEVLFWLLERCEGNSASIFLSELAEDYEAGDQANDPPKHADIVATLDLLRERISERRVQQHNAQQ
jgi:hypothetical protein